MTFPDDENPLNGGQQPPTAEEQPKSTPVEPAAELELPGEQVVPPFPSEEDAAPEFDFPRMEEDVAAFHRELDELQFTPAVRSPEEEPVRASSTPRRRRRTQRIIERPDASELGERLKSIAYRAAPTFDFFVFSFLCGCILGLGYILDAPAILLIGILVAPIVSPWVGAALSACDRGNTFLWADSRRLSYCAVHGLFRWVVGGAGFADLPAAHFFTGFFAFPVVVARPALAGHRHHDPGDCFYSIRKQTGRLPA